jgi:hypothetical protein
MAVLGEEKGTFQTLRCNNFRTTKHFFNLWTHLPNHFDFWIPWSKRFPASVLHGSSILFWKKVIDFWAERRHVRRRAMLPASLKNGHASWTWICSSHQYLTFYRKNINFDACWTEIWNFPREKTLAPEKKNRLTNFAPHSVSAAFLFDK